MTTAAIKKLKQRIKDLERKEAQSRKQLKRAMQHAEKLAMVYKSRFKTVLREMKIKHAFERALAYARAACDMERKMLKQAEKKSKVLLASIAKVDKAEIVRILKNACVTVDKKRKKPKRSKKLK